MPALITSRISGRSRAAIFYFCFMGAGGVIGPFLYVTYRHHGLTPSQIGVVIAVAHVMNFVVSPIWGGISDLVRRRGRIPLLAIACLGAGPGILLVQLASGLFPTLGAVILWSLFSGGIVSLADTATLRLLGDNTDSFGRIRVWGSVGGVLASLIAGKLGNLVGLDVIFPLYTGLLLVCGLIAAGFPSGTSDQPVKFTHGMASLVRDLRVPLFLSTVLFLGVGYMSWRSTFALYLEDLGGDPGLIGIFFALSSLIEIPIMATSSYWLGVKSGRRALLGSFAVFSLMWLGCSLIVSPNAFIPLAIAHGFSYAVYQIAGVVYMRGISPPEHMGLAQGVYGGFSRGLGSIVGSLAGGMLYEKIGGAAVYRLSAQAGLVALILFALTQIASVRRWREETVYR